MNTFYLAIASLILFVSCTLAPDIVGKWTANGTTGSLEFHKNGSVVMVDNMGATFKGSYIIIKEGGIELIFTHSDILSDSIKQMDDPEIVNGKIYMKGNELRLTSLDSKEVLRYRR